MARKMLVALMLASAMALIAAPALAAPAEPAADPSVQAVTASNALAARLYRRLAESGTIETESSRGNVFFSPFSIDVALAMTFTGARDGTAEEMRAILGLPILSPGPEGTDNAAAQAKLDQETLAALGALARDLSAEKGPDGKPRAFQLSVANALWGQTGEPFLPDFLKTLKDNFGAGLSEADFAKDTEGARKAINTWAEKETHDKIKDLLKPGVLTTKTRLVLTNAIYFKGTWAEPFKKEATQDAPFQALIEKIEYTGGTPITMPYRVDHISYESKPVPLMNRTGEYGYFEEEMFQGLKLPYAGNELSMVILLPKKVSWVFEGKTVDALEDLEKQVTPANLKAWMGKFHTQNVVVAIPKFKMTTEVELSRSLTSLGKVDASTYLFTGTGRADFSGMNGKKDLFISAVVHKAFIDVNEEGTEAAAATFVPAVTASAPAQPEPPKVFRADHPFLFLIRHEKSGAILFMGRVADPTK